MVAAPYKIAALLVCMCLLLTAPAHARGGYVIIQDAEVENVLKSYTVPLFKAAGLNSKSLRLFIVKDDDINAFATNGNAIFIFTGLILKSNDYSEVEGVLAHETGHISGGHLLRLYDNISMVGRNSLISTILGGVAAIASGRPDVGAAVAMGGMDASQKAFLSYRRGEEHIADQIAVKLLEKTDSPLQGFYDMMKTINTQERFRSSSDSYLSTHPLSADRLAFIENAIKTDGSRALDKDKQEQFLRIKAKLAAFLGDPDRTLAQYKGDTYSDRYARSIAWFRKHDINKALTELDSLIKDNDDIAYLYELKGQILFENGRVKESIEPYRMAYKLDRSPLIRLSLAQAEIEAGDKKMLEGIIADLKKIVAGDQGNATAFRYLAICSGKTGEISYAAYYMAEYNFLTGRYKEALEQAERAEKKMPESATAWLRIQDIKDAAKAQLKKQQERM